MDYKREKVFLTRKKIIMFFLILCCVLWGCSMEQTSKPQSWIPVQGETPIISEEPESNETLNAPVYSSEELTNKLLQDSGRDFADMLWENQKAGGGDSYDQAQLGKGKLLIYYVSSSEGDDANDGLSSETPKKSLEQFSGISNINILLKCGDTFHMTESFIVGDSVTLASYGEGSRPVLSYYQPLKVQWNESVSYENVWCADLKEISLLYDDTAQRSNCNIGHLLIEGECNWKRKVKNEGENFRYEEYLSEAADGSWAVDWENSVIYLYAESDPGKMEICYALPVHGLQMNNIGSSQILGLEITGAGFHGISLCNANHIKIQSCYIHHIGGAFRQGVGSRYGNAVEIWDSGQQITVSYNVADWIFDTCYTNQGSGADAVEKNIVFSYNIGRYCFWGIETWGDGYAEQPFANIVYKGNILMNACDVTAPEATAFCNEQEQLINENGNRIETQVPYVSYREGYTYHQMSLLNAADNCQEGELAIEGNVFWGTKRFLGLFSKLDRGRGFPLPENNLFYGSVPAEEICLFRYTESDGSRHFLQKLPLGMETNKLIVRVGERQENFKTARNILKETVEIISNGSE